jgi:nucleoside-triphosphatase
MKHIFLTGDRQVGKSTAINKALSAAAPVVGGFRTLAGAPENAIEYVHLVRADGTEPFSQENRAFQRRFVGEKRLFTVYPQVFEEHGAALLQPEPGCQLILMDELGLREAACQQFRAAVLSALDGSIPVLGVVQDRDGGFLDDVRHHPQVQLLTVTLENRDAVAQQLISYLYQFCG